MTNKFNRFSMSLLTLSLTACGGGGNGNAAIPASTNSSSTQQFAMQISQIHNNSSPLTNIQSNLVNYYSKVQATKTIVSGDVTIDCVPFAQQPSLINLSANEVQIIKRRISAPKYTNTAKITNTHQFLISPTQCPIGSVAVTRPPLQNIQNGMLSAFNKYPNDDGLSAYNWVQVSESGNTNQGTYDLSTLNPQSTSVVFDAQFNPTMIMPVLDGSHVINQSWWVSNDERPYLMTLETGLIKSAYFTQNIAITIFVFSTVSGYGPGPAGGCYNLSCGDFIQYPNTPALGAPITPSNGSYTFTYQAIAEGYEMVLTYTSNTNSTDNWSYPIGYYPSSRYSTTNPLTNNPFVSYQAGAEIETGNNIDQFLINGAVYGIYYNLTNMLPIGSFNSPHNSQIYLANIIWNPLLNNNTVQFYTAE